MTFPACSESIRNAFACKRARVRVRRAVRRLLARRCCRSARGQSSRSSSATSASRACSAPKPARSSATCRSRSATASTDEKDLGRGQGAVRDRLLSRRAPRGAGRRADRLRAGAADDQLDHLRRQQGIRHRHDQEGAEGHRHRRGADLRPLGARARRAGAEAPVHHARQVRGQRADDGHAAGAQPRRDQLHDRRRRFGEDRADQHRRRQGVHGEAAAVAR